MVVFCLCLIDNFVYTVEKIFNQTYSDKNDPFIIYLKGDF